MSLLQQCSVQFLLVSLPADLSSLFFLHHHHRPWSQSPLYDQGRPNRLHSSLSISCYICKTYYLISPSNSLSSFTIPELPFCYSNSPSIISLFHNVSCLSTFLFQLYSRCLQLWSAPFLSLHVMPSIMLSIPLWVLWRFCSRSFVKLQVSDPYVRTGRMHW